MPKKRVVGRLFNQILVLPNGLLLDFYCLSMTTGSKENIAQIAATERYFLAVKAVLGFFDSEILKQLQSSSRGHFCVIVPAGAIVVRAKISTQSPQAVPKTDPIFRLLRKLFNHFFPH